MNRENILFALVGLLLGYVIAFHIVVYINQNQPQSRSAQAQASADDGSPSGSSSLPANDTKDKQRLQSAAAQAAKAAREDKKNFDAQFKAGVASLDAGDAEGAIDFLTLANQLRPADYESIVQLGNANLQANRLEVAERWYKEALQKKPDDIIVRSNLSLSYFKRTPPQADKSIAELKRALDYDPENTLVLYNLTYVLAQTGDFDAAEATLARVEKLSPDEASELRKLIEEVRRDGASSTGDGDGKEQKKSPTD